MEKVLKYIIENTASEKIDKKVAVNMIKMLKNEGVKPKEDIAIIGMAARLPMANNVDEYWDNIRRGLDCVGKFPEARKKDIDRYLRFLNTDEGDIKYIDGAYLSRIDDFDYKFFKISPKEASLMDPFQRIFMQAVWEALEDSGYGGEKLIGSNTGIYVGYASNPKDCYNQLVFNVDPSLINTSLFGNITALMPTRISYFLDFKGPTMVVDTACSSSLVSVHLACQGIRNGDCDIAIAGGVRVNLIPQDIDYYRLGIESSDDRARTFDDSSDGTGMGEGIAAIILKPLSKALKDRDNIYAVIKGSAINQDGKSIGITAPNPASQADVITKAWEMAGIDPEAISYIEVHGTGTSLGDPIEIDGLQRAFRRYTDKKQFCAIGSTKTNVGHLYECSGLAGLIKVVMMLKNKEIPAHLHLNLPNRKINFEDSPVYINDSLIKWESIGDSRICGISSFGFSGTNSHLVLEEACEQENSHNCEKDDLLVLTISAKSRESLEDYIEKYKQFLFSKPDARLEDICFTSNCGRGHYNHRLVITTNNEEDLLQKLNKLSYINFYDTQEPWFFYGDHKIVAGNKEIKVKGEIREQDRVEFTRKAQEKIKEFISSGRTSAKALEEICSLYVLGADVNWDQYYEGRQMRRVRIPTYPFERSRCWIDVPEPKKAVIDMTDNKAFFETVWSQEPLLCENADSISEAVMILCDKAGIGEKLATEFKNQGTEVILVEFTGEFKKIDDYYYTIGGDEKHFNRLIAETRSVKLAHIIHLFTIEPDIEVSSLKDLKESQNRGIMSLFHLTRALLNEGNGSDSNILVVTSYANEVTGQEERINAENATIVGLGKVIDKEYRNIRCRCIDIDEHMKVEHIIDELLYGSGTYQVAYRNGVRYIEEFRYAEVMDKEERKIELKETGVYVITGGTGGIGLEVAKYIASRGNVNIALINRSSMPERENWNQLLKTGDKKVIDKIKAIRQLESYGSRVSYFSVDISDFDEVKALIASLKEDYGKINGIIHSAGVAGDGFIAAKDEKVFMEVLRPKVFGTWILNELTKEEDLDFFIMFSSLASLCSSPGQGDYTAANSYLDAFASYRNKFYKNTFVVNWSTWKETGMAANYGANEDGAFKALYTKRAMKLFDIVLHRNIKRVVIGELNFEEAFVHLKPEFFVDHFPLKLSSEVKSDIDRWIKLSAENECKNEEGKQKNIRLRGKENGEYSNIEKTLANIWGKVLGFNEIDVYSNFYEIGGDSISGLKIANAISKETVYKVNVTDLFKYPTIVELAEYLNTKDSGNDIEKLYSSIKPVEKREYYPVSPSQKGLYLLNQLDGIGTSYNLPGAMLIEGNLDIEKLENVFIKLIQRHETLRTSFEFIDGEVYQKVHENVEFKVDYMELLTQDEEKCAKQLFHDFVKPFDLRKAPMFRAKLVKLRENRYVLMYDMHHIISDGTSNRIIEQEFAKLYRGEELSELNIQYKDYSIWQNDLLNSSFISKQQEYWLKKYSGDIPVLNMPTDYPRTSIQSFEGSSYDFVIGRELTSEIKELTTQTDTTLYMVLMAVYNVLLWKYTRQEDIIVGSPVSGRYHSDLDNIVGMFVNTLAMRNYPSSNKTFKQFLDEVRENSLEAYANQHYPFEKLVENMKARKDLSRNPLFDVMFVLQNMEIKEVKIDNLKISPYENNEEVSNLASKFDMTLSVTEIDGELKFNVEYCTKLFKSGTIKRFAEHYINIVKDVVMNPGKKLYEIEILDGKEKERIITVFNDTSSDYNRAELICSLFKDQVARTPDNIAVSSWDDKLTYRELDRRSNKLAGLLRQKGITRETVVGIMLERSSAMIVAILGVLKAGGAYLPIDPTYPNERISFMLDDSHARILLSTRELMDKMSFERFEGEWLDMEASTDSIGEEIDCYDVSELEDAAYIIYTSGTTGKPKGVVVEHRNLIAYVNAFRKEFALSEEDVMLQQASFSFDAFVEEVYPVLTSGGKLVIPKRQSIVDIEKLVKIMREEQTTIMSCSPLLLNELNKHSAMESMKVYISGGDVLKWEHISNLIKRAQVYNTYGPTESTVCATYYRCDESSYEVSIPIGKPIANYKVYVMDKYMNLMPVGVPGELCIAGEGVARGYLGMERLTEEKFVQSPFNANERIYRTGDLAKWREDGNIEFLGRIDSQVKIRGYRIELGEIERQLIKHRLVTDAVVIDRENSEGDKFLCAYLVTSEKLTLQDLKAHLLKELPEYMIPSYFIQVDAIPRTTSGKLDRNSLPGPVESIDTGVEYVAPKGMKEERLAEVWQEVLGIEKIGANDNFFDIGGNSIKAIQVVSKLNTDYAITINQIFEHQTIRSLAANIDHNKDNLNTIIESAKELAAVTEGNAKISIEDYPEVQEKLEKYKQLNKRYESIDLSVNKKYENILLTGSTGYLGIYLVKELLETTSSGIYLPTRAENQKEAEERFLGKLRFYFNEGLYEKYRDRIHVFNGDLSEDKLGLEKEEYTEFCEKIDCVINSAANVRHYGRYSEFEKINVLGTQKMVEFCKTGKIKDYNHISTISVGSGYIEEKDYELFTEYDCDIGQDTNSYYVKSKIEAEKLILKAREEGLNVNIFRPGNLVFNSETGKFQENISENNFYRMLKSVLKLGVVPELKNITLDFSYIDYVSKAIVLLFDKTELINENHHIFNLQSTDMLEFADIIRSLGYKIDKIEFDDFMDYLLRSYENDPESVNNVLSSIMGNTSNTTKIDVMLDRTAMILERLGLVWPKLNDEYVGKMLEYCNKIKYFDGIYFDVVSN